MTTYIHIGSPKAASTTLQKQLFAEHSNINYLGIYPQNNIGIDTATQNASTLYLHSEQLRTFHQNLVHEEGINFKYSNTDILFENIQEQLYTNDKVNVLSNERFTSIFFSHPDRAEKARRLKKFFSDAKILIIIRNQFDIIKSQYRDHPFDPRSFAIGKPVNIDEWVTIDSLKREINFLQSLEYDKIIKFYEELFGVENVKVLLFEDMKQNLNKFSSEISNFINIDENETFKLLNAQHENIGVSDRFNTYRHLKRKYPLFKIGKLFPKSIKEYIENTLKKGNKKHLTFSKSSQDLIINQFRACNQLIQDKYKLELEKYNYPL